MCFDVPKVVRSPGCDHGHDEESRNGRDMKIDILDDYIRTPEWFRGLSDITGVPGVTGTPRRLLGLMGQIGGRGEVAKGSHAPLPSQVRIGQGRGVAPPFLSSSFSFPLLSYSNMEGGSPTPGGSRTPHGARQGSPAPSPSSTPLYMGREAPPRDTTIDPLDLLAVCGAPLHHNPPRSYRSGA